MCRKNFRSPFSEVIDYGNQTASRSAYRLPSACGTRPQGQPGFLQGVLAVLEIPIVGTTENYFWADELVVSSVESPEALGLLKGRHHLAFQAGDRTRVDAFHRVALAHGGRDNGAPGERAYHPGYYAAFVLDPDGNNIEAVFHGEAQRSAPSVVIDFQG